MDNFIPDMDEKLVQLLDGTLPETEKKQLLSQLENDPVLHEAFEKLKATREAVQFYGLKQQVGQWHSEMMQEMQTPVKTISPVKRILRYSAGIAAAAVLIAAVFFLTNPASDTTGSVYSAYYQPYELRNLRGESGVQDSMEIAYSKKDYTAVRKLFEANRTDSIKALLLNGTAALELNDPQTAIGSFNRILELNKTTGLKQYQDETEYYLALAYLKNNQPAPALTILEKIDRDPGHPYHSKISGGLIEKVLKLNK